MLSTPAAVAELARDLLYDADDDRENFWGVYLDAQNRYRYSVEISVGTQNASLVNPRERPRPGAAPRRDHPDPDPQPSER